jgi:hypothetical protein
MRRMAKHELWWVAGLLEGEGCFGTQKSGYVTIQVQTADREVIEKLVEFTGLGHVSGPFKTRAAHHAPMYGWHPSGANAVALIELVYPLLSSRRQARIDETLVLWSGWLQRQTEKRQVQEQIRDRRVKDLKAMRKRGMSFREISEATGIPRSTVADRLR